MGIILEEAEEVRLVRYKFIPHNMRSLTLGLSLQGRSLSSLSIRELSIERVRSRIHLN